MNARHFYSTWVSPQRWLQRAGVRAPMQLVFGLVLLTLCVLLFADSVRLVPSDVESSLRERIVLAELVSSSAASAINAGDYASAQRLLDSIVKRYGNVLSIGLRRPDGSIAVQTHHHREHWGDGHQRNTPTHFCVVLYAGQKRTGEFEFAFKQPESATSWAGFLRTRTIRLTVFILGGAFLLYWIFLSRMLRMLDPTAAVPERTQLLMNTLVEGIAILDERDQIVMTNEAFARTAFISIERLIGQTLSSLPWLSGEAGHESPDYPWNAVRRSGLPHRGVVMRLQVGTRDVRRLTVNAAPVLDPRGTRRGVLVTFSDETIVEAENEQLRSVVARVAEASKPFHPDRMPQVEGDGDDQLARLDELTNAARAIARMCDAPGERAGRKNGIGPMYAPET